MNNEQDRTTLRGKTIVVTRRKEQAAEFSQLLEQAGARVILFPVVEIVGPQSWSKCDAAIGRLEEYSAIIFTSRNAVIHFFNRAEFLGKKESIRRCRLYAVGEKTQRRIEDYGFKTEKLAEHYSAEDLARSIVQENVKNKKFLFPKGNLARNETITILSEHGAIVDDVIVYQTVEPKMNDDRRTHVKRINEDADLITFFSPSSVTHAMHALSLDLIRTKQIAVFGETTALAAREAGLKVNMVAPQSSIGAFVEAIQNFYSTQLESEHGIKK